MASVAASVTADLVAALKLDVKTKSQLYRDAVSDSGVSADAVDAAKAALRDSLRELAAAQEDDNAKINASLKSEKYPVGIREAHKENETFMLLGSADLLWN